MARYSIDCREFPNAIRCTVKMSADDEEEVLVAAMHHAIKVHAMRESPQVLARLRSMIRAG